MGLLLTKICIMYLTNTFNHSILVHIHLSDAWIGSAAMDCLLLHLPMPVTCTYTSLVGYFGASNGQGLMCVALCRSCTSWALLGSVVKSGH
jgi:hypothetical protein